MKQYNNETMERGVSIYLAIMVMTILLAIGLGISLIIVSQMRMIRGMENSVIAFHAADTGIEEIMYKDKECWQENCPAYCQGYPDACSGLPETYSFSGNLDNGASYDTSHEHKIRGPLDEPPCCDPNGDGVVDQADIDLFTAMDCYGKYIDEYPECEIFDCSHDGWADSVDLVFFLSPQMGSTCDYLFCISESTGAFEKTKRAIEVTIY